MTTTSTAPAPEKKEETKGLSQGAIVRKRFFGNTAAVISLVIFVLVVILAFSSIGFAGIPGWWSQDFSTAQPLLNKGAPSAQHPFGQNQIGVDYFAMTMRGTQVSLIIMVIIAGVGGVIGVFVGALSGYFRGWVEAILMRFTDIIIIIPVIVLAAVVGATAGNRFSGTAAVVFLGIFMGLVIWTTLARLVRGEFLSIREREFVDAARIAGASNTRIMFKHMMPNAIGTIIVNVTLLLSTSILLETGLSYVGVGVKFPDVSLGLAISSNQTAFATRPWLFWFPGLFIVIICLTLNFVGDGLRDAFDPRQKKFRGKKAKAVAVATDHVVVTHDGTQGVAMAAPSEAGGASALSDAATTLAVESSQPPAGEEELLRDIIPDEEGGSPDDGEGRHRADPS